MPHESNTATSNESGNNYYLLLSINTELADNSVFCLNMKVVQQKPLSSHDISRELLSMLVLFIQ